MSQFFTSGGQSIAASALASVLPMNISFRMDWLDLPEVQGTLKSLLQHHNSRASILWCSAFFIVQLSHPYVTTGKTISLTMWLTNTSRGGGDKREMGSPIWISTESKMCQASRLTTTPGVNWGGALWHPKRIPPQAAKSCSDQHHDSW